jgi:hypothetical protein
MTEIASAPQVPIAPGKACGGCTLCCKVMRIDELAKPTGTWCTHCKPGTGCRIYESRPQVCRSFMCLWLLSPELGPEWRPDRSKLVLMTDDTGERMIIKCDPGFPRAWRKEPYYSRIGQMAEKASLNGSAVIILAGHDMTVLARGQELHVGIVREEDQFFIDYDAAGRLQCRVTPRDA